MKLPNKLKNIFTTVLLITFCSCNDGISNLEPVLLKYQELNCISKRGESMMKEKKEKYRVTQNQKEKDFLNDEIAKIRNAQQQIYNKISELADEITKHSFDFSNSENVKLSKLMTKEVECVGWDEYISNLKLNDDLKSSESPSETEVAKQTEDNIKRKMAEDFVRSFYESMELSQKEVEKLMETGDDNFPQSKINKLKSMNVFNAKQRVKNLTGIYYDRYYVELKDIDSISVNDTQIKAYTTVLYGLYETGKFYNIERIDISDKNNGELKITKWIDLKLLKMELKDYEGLENFSEKDFYKSIDYKW